MVVEITKVAQVGAGAGMILVPMFLGGYRQKEQVIANGFLLVCIGLVLVCPLILWFSGERKRAWQGLVLTIALTLLGAALSGPVLIR